MGSVYRPINRKGEPSPNWWLRYTANGKQHRENSRSTDRRVAERLLKQREGRAAAGQVVNPHADRVISSAQPRRSQATLRWPRTSSPTTRCAVAARWRSWKTS